MSGPRIRQDFTDALLVAEGGRGGNYAPVSAAYVAVDRDPSYANWSKCEASMFNVLLSAGSKE